MPTPTLLHRAFVAIAVGATLVACSDRQAETALASARQHLEQGDYAAARVELKNALQAAPRLAEARFLMARVLLQQDDYAAAEIELHKALDDGYPAELVVPQLAKAMWYAERSDELVKQFRGLTLKERAANAELLARLSLAYGRLGDPTRADSLLRSAREAQIDHPVVLIVQARRLAGEGKLAAAMQLLDQVLAADPANVEALQVKGDLQAYGLNDRAAAIATYAQVLKLRPASAPTHAALVALTLGAGEVEHAEARLEAFRKARPGHPLVPYLRAAILQRRGDLRGAAEAAEQALKQSPEHPSVLEISGAIELQRGHPAEGARLLNKAVQLAPEGRNARVLLARAWVAAGEPDRALQALQPLVSSGRADTEAALTAGVARMHLGDLAGAEAMFRTAAKGDPGNALSRVAVAATRISRGDTAGGSDELLRVSESDPGIAADMLLITASQRSGDLDGALKAVDRLEKKTRGQALAPTLAGTLLAQRGDLPGARRSFERALAVDPNHFAAVLGLADLDEREGRADAAYARVAKVADAQPTNASAVLMLARIKDRSGGSADEVDALLQRAVKADPRDVAARRAIVDHRLRHRRFPAALAAAQDAAVALPNDPGVIEALAQAQAASGAREQAVSTYRKLAVAVPESPLPHLQVARLLREQQETAAADDALAKAAAVAGDRPAAVRAVVATELEWGRATQALARTRKLQAAVPQSPDGPEMEADVLCAQKLWTDCAAAYQRALKLSPASATIAPKLHAALRDSGAVKEAEAFSAGWQKAHPADTAFLSYLGDVALQSKNLEGAEAAWKKALPLDANNPALLNNLAWVMGRLKRPGAVELAERAVRLNPGQPAYLDTLATLLAERGQLERAIALERRALELAPELHPVRLALAEMLIQRGDKAAARSELQTLAALGDAFALQAQVRALQQKF